MLFGKIGHSTIARKAWLNEIKKAVQQFKLLYRLMKQYSTIKYLKKP